MKRYLKQLARIIAAIVVAPLALYYALAAMLCGSEAAFAGVAQCVALLPGKTGIYLRAALLRYILPRCAADAQICFGALLTSPQTTLGQRVYVGPYSVLGDVALADDVLIASHVSLINGGRQHGSQRVDVSIAEQQGELPRITIGTGSWIGERAVVMANVGRHCIVGAGAVVTHPLPDYAVAAGVPAKILRFREAAAVEEVREVEQLQAEVAAAR